jgi:hypothetical protein
MEVGVVSEDDARILIETIEGICAEQAQEQGIGTLPLEALMSLCLDPDSDAEKLAAYRRVKESLGSK